MARKKSNIHYIYKTTCNVTGKWYVGMHSTSNLNDGYMGSGKRLRYSIRKYSIENHTKEILEYLPTRELLIIREIEIVTKELIADDLCMNLKEGGTGGFSNEKQMINCTKAGKKAFLDKLQNDIEFRNNWLNNLRKGVLKSYENGRAFNLKDYWNGKTHSEETKKLLSEIKKGKGTGTNNSQFGTCWITNEIENKKINKNDEIPDGWRLGRILKNQF